MDELMGESRRSTLEALSAGHRSYGGQGVSEGGTPTQTIDQSRYLSIWGREPIKSLSINQSEGLRVEKSATDSRQRANSHLREVLGA